MAAGPNALRGSGPNPTRAFEDALTLAGSPDPRNDHVCITSLCPRQFCMLLTATPPATTSAHEPLTAPHSRASGAKLFICNDPSKNRLDRGEAWIFRLAHDGEQLEPELVVGALHKIANGACDEIRRDHGRCCSASLDSGGESRIQRRKHRARHIRTIEIGN